MAEPRQLIGEGHQKSNAQSPTAISRPGEHQQTRSDSKAEGQPPQTSNTIPYQQPLATNSFSQDVEGNRQDTPTPNNESQKNNGDQISRTTPKPGPPGPFLSASMSKSREIAFNIMICMVQLIPQACLTTCFPSSITIAKFFDIKDPSLIPWMIAAYALTFGTFILVAGRLGDIFGHKRMVVIGFCFMAFWSAVAGFSNYATYEVFFIARAMQGIGSAMMNPNGLALLGRTYAPGSKQKIIAFSLFGLCAPVGAYSGMLFGAIFSELLHWSWAFYTLAIVSVVLAALAQVIFISPPPTPKQMLPFTARLQEMDWLGAFTGVAGLVCIEVAWICAPSEGWNTQYIYMLLIIGVLLAAAFGIVETRLAAQPLVPFNILKSEVGFVLAAVACGWAAFGIWSWYLWRFLLGVWHDLPLTACLHVLPIVPVAIVASAVTAVLMRKAKPGWILIGALTAFTLGPVFLALAEQHQVYWTFIFVSLLLMPWGMDMSLPSAMMIMSNNLPMDKQGIAGSLVTTVVNYSISLGLGFAATAEVQANKSGQDILAGIKAACCVGIGLGVLGILVTLAFIVKCALTARREKRADTLQVNRDRSATMSSQATLIPSGEKSTFRPLSRPLSSDQELMSLVNPLPTSRDSDEAESLREPRPTHQRTGSEESVEVFDSYDYERPRRESRPNMSSFPGRIGTAV